MRQATHFLLLSLFPLLSWKLAYGGEPARVARTRRWEAHAGGTLKSIIALQKLRQTGLFDHDLEPVSEQRLRVTGTLSKDWFLFEFANELSVFFQGANDPLVNVSDFSPSSAWDSKWHWVDTPSLDVIERIDRLFVQVSQGPVELTVGKQVVATGVGHIFSSVSQVPRLPFIVVDAEYPMTEDAISAVWKGPLVLEGRFLPKTREQRNHNFHLRAKGSKGGYDIALTSGRSDDKVYIGLETAGNVGESLLRGELVGYDAEGVGFVQSLIGLDHVFSPKWSAEVELFYNGFGKTNSQDYRLEPFLHRSAPYRGVYYAGTTVSYEITPRLKSHLLTLANLLDPSFLFHLFFTYSLGSNLDLLLGQYLSAGTQTQSEFGGKLPLTPQIHLGLPDMTYLVLKWYF